MKVQVAFQGGGARVADLLSVVEQLQSFERSSLLQVSRVAGTSAGALAAAVAACGGESAAKLRTYIRGNARGIVRTLAGNDSGEIELCTIRGARRVLSGAPIIDTIALRNVLTNCFQVAWHAGLAARGKGEQDAQWHKTSWTLGDIRNLSGIRLIVLAADVVSREPIVYSNDEMNVIEALVNSAAIPFVLRGYKALAANPTVDGGLCENMPSDTLRKDEREFGQVLAVSFLSDDNAKDRGKVPSSNFQFVGKLIQTAINSSVVRSLKPIPESNILRLKSSNSTLDFVRAFVDQTDDANAYVASQTQSKLSGMVRSPPPPPKAEELFAQAMADVWEWYLEQQKNVRRRNIKSVLIARAESCKPDPSGITKPDGISKEYHIAPLNDSVLMFHISIGPEWFQAVIDIDVSDPTYKAVKFRKIPCSSKTSSSTDGLGKIEFGYVLLFDKPLSPLTDEQLNQGRSYRVRARYKQQGGLSGLVSADALYSDSIIHRNRRAEEYESVEVIVKVPKVMRLRTYAQWSDLELAGDHIQNPQIADALEESEIRNYEDDPEWHCYGWRVKNFPTGRVLKIDLEHRPNPV